MHSQSKERVLSKGKSTPSSLPYPTVTATLPTPNSQSPPFDPPSCVPLSADLVSYAGVEDW